MEIKIEKNIPVTKRSNYGIGYPFDKMEVVDSFAIECSNEININNKRSQIIANAKNYTIRHKLDWKFTSQITGRVIRIWRIK